MKVETILKSKERHVATARSSVRVGIVVHRLKLEGIGAIVINDDEGKMAGIVSERDIVHALATHGGDALEMRADEIMTRSIITCTPEDSIKHLMALMTRRHVRHLPVIEGGELAGIISVGDVVKNRLEEVELEANVLRDVYIASH